MSIDCEQEIIELGKTCVGIRIELFGVQELMKKLTSNQDTLIILTQRSENTEKRIDKIDKALGKNFEELRCLQAQRLGPRMSELESGNKWRRVTFYLTLISLSLGGITLWIKKILES